MPPDPTVLLGRDRELALVEQLVQGVRSEGAALLVRGEAGIGKTALLRAAEDIARRGGLRVLSATGAEAEEHLPFAGIHQLLLPLLSDASALPQRQHDALLSAFGLSPNECVDVYLVALAALNLVGRAASEQPLLLVLEDAQWFDRASADAMAFVGRRVSSEPVVMLAALRDGIDHPLDGAGLRELRLDRLPEDVARKLLGIHAPDLDGAVRSRLLAIAAGNPLALMELPMATGAAALYSRTVGLSARLEHAFAARTAGLPELTQTILLVAALNDGSDLVEILDGAAVATSKAVGGEDLGPAVGARLIEVGAAELRFRHPLMRSAITQAASRQQRRAAHAALSTVLSDQPDRQLWHRAAASTGPNEDTAIDLEAAADRAMRRGAVAPALQHFEQAAALSTDEPRRVERLLRAAEAAFELGRHDAVLALLRTASELGVTPAQRARMSWIRERFTEGRLDDAGFSASLVATAQQLARQDDRDRALGLLRGAAIAAYFSDAPAAARSAIAEVAESVRTDPSDARRLGILAYVQPIASGTAVIEQLEDWEADLISDPETALMLALAGCAVGEFGLAAGYSWAAVRTLRAQGRLGYLARALIASAFSEAYLANLRPALASAAEAASLAIESSQPLLVSLAETSAAMCVALGEGRAGAERLADSAAFASVPADARATRSKAQHVLGVAALADGCYDEAFAQLSRAFDPEDGSFHHFMRWCALGDLADAAARSGQSASIASILAESEAIGRRTRASGVHANLVFARAVLADDDHAEALFAAALDHDLRRWPFIRARTQLAFGEWLRRERRLDESRLHLRSARESFDALGTRPWSEMARQQLRASGEASGPPAALPEAALSAQELQIAQLAASGLTNRQIGDQLFLSHRTIGAQLYKIYPKLRITSRSELARVLGSPTTLEWAANAER